MTDAFDPRPLLIKMSRRQKGEDGQLKSIQLEYLEVKNRLLWFRQEHPDGDIVTEMVKDEGDEAVFRALVSVPNGGSATGWGSEEASDWKDYREKAETKAVGRALAALGYGTQFAVEVDEGSTAAGPQVVDAPVQRQPATNGRQAPPAQGGGWLQRPATEPQIKAIYALARGHGMDADRDADEWCQARFGVLPGELSRRQASEAIDALRLGAGMPAASPANPAPAMPQATAVAAAGKPAGPRRMTEAQQRWLSAYVQSPAINWGVDTERRLDDLVGTRFGLASLAELSIEQAGELIEDFKAGKIPPDGPPQRELVGVPPARTAAHDARGAH